MVRDSLFDVRWHFVKRICQQWLDSLDRVKYNVPSQVVMASGIIFLLTCDRFKLSPREVLDVADTVIRKSFDIDPRYVRGIQEYLKKELADG